MNYPTIIIEDTRNQKGKHDNIAQFCEERGILIVRSKLECGDYSLPTDRSVCIDTKFGMLEVYGNMTREHDRFAREADLARQLGIRLVVLVEEERIRSLSEVRGWKNPRIEKYEWLKKMHERGRYCGTPLPPKAPVPSERLERMMQTFAEHRGIEWRFCRKAETGETICRILMKEE